MEYFKDIFFPDPVNIDEIPFSPELIRDIQDNFNIPIAYLENKQDLSSTIKNDIELTKVYEKLFKPASEVSKCLYDKWGTYTTTNIQFLKDTQTIIHNVNHIDSYKDHQWEERTNKMSYYWRDIYNPQFCSKYSFFEWSIFKPLNASIPFLTLLSLSNMLSPLIFFIMPLILLMVPFVILKFQGVPISTDKYFDILKHIAKNHFIGKALIQMENISFTNVIQIIFYLFMYLLQIYNNIQSCKKYYSDIVTVNENIISLKQHINDTIRKVSTFKQISQQCSTYCKFNEDCDKQMIVLHKLERDLKDFNYTQMKVSNVFDFGWVLKHYYAIYDNDEYKKAISFSIGFNEYIHHLQLLHNNIGNRMVGGAQFSNKTKTSLKKQYYPLLESDITPISNDCNLKKNIIVTGANASGKTTYLKSTTINIILSQQFGFGFYTSASINPYTRFHTYLNIPDTSERDSLFQAESRRCKEIIDILENTDVEQRHFCIFDELYSGTNPDEASKSGVAFLSYLNKFNNLDYILTTHYVYICNKFKKSKETVNYKMETTLNEVGNCVFHYKIKKGISKIRGALSVLRQMNYPKDIIENIETLNA